MVVPIIIESTFNIERKAPGVILVNQLRNFIDRI